jgi:hypothetical protein
MTGVLYVTKPILLYLLINENIIEVKNYFLEVPKY